MGKSQLTPRQRVNRFARKVAPLYGFDETGPPNFRFGKVPVSGAFGATTFEGDRPTVHFNQGTTKQLRSRDPFKRRDARRVMLWESGRTIQGDRPDSWLIHKTNSVSRRLNKAQARDRKQHLRYLDR